jgi:hypothetical protein
MAAQEPEPVTTNVAPSAKAYLDALAEYNLLEGEVGNQTVRNEAQECLAALHHVLGGGRVRVAIEDEGATSVVERLEGTLEAALDETNAIRRRGGEADY